MNDEMTEASDPDSTRAAHHRCLEHHAGQKQFLTPIDRNENRGAR